MLQDNNFLKASIFSAIISALAGVLTLYTASYSPLLFFIFSLLTIMPIVAVSLIKGIRAGAISTLISVIISSFALPLSFAVSLYICLLFPALYISFILNIVAVEKQTQKATWLPLPTILFNICITCVVVVILLASYINMMLPAPLLSDTTLATIKTFIDANIQIYVENFRLSPEEIIQFTQTFDQNFVLFIIGIMAWSVISSLFFMLLLSVYSITRIVSDKQLSLRPKNFWPKDLVMPPAGLAIFLCAMFTASFSGINYTLLLCLFSLAIAFALGFLVSGLAFVHCVTIGKPWRVVVLAVVYILLFSFIFSSLATLMLISLGVVSTIIQAIKNNTQPPSYNL